MHWGAEITADQHIYLQVRYNGLYVLVVIAPVLVILPLLLHSSSEVQVKYAQGKCRRSTGEVYMYIRTYVRTYVRF